MTGTRMFIAATGNNLNEKSLFTVNTIPLFIQWNTSWRIKTLKLLDVFQKYYVGGGESDIKEYSMILCIWSSKTGKTTLMVIEIWTVVASGNLLERRQGNFLGWWRYLYCEWGGVTLVYNFSKLMDVLIIYITILQAYWGKTNISKHLLFCIHLTLLTNKEIFTDI